MLRAILFLFFSTVALPSGTAAAADFSSVDSLPFFYQRTAYLENLLQAGAWWSNPALISSIDKTSLFASNTGLLGGKYDISSIRILFPAANVASAGPVTAGFGLTGTTTTEGRSFSGSNSGAQYGSNFKFARPSIEAGASWAPNFGGSIGTIFATGTEGYPSNSFSGLTQYYFFLGLGAGVLSPVLAKGVQLSFSTLSVRHFLVQPWWDNAAKAGLLVSVMNGTLRGAVEYAFSLDNRLLFLRDQDDISTYEVLRATVSIRFRSIAGLLLGFSKDAPHNLRDNRSTLHGGLELRPSDIYPYWGGAEAGLSTSTTRNNSVSLMFRFWVGYCFKKQEKK